MINWFLRAKHWQLFLLTFGVIVITYAVFMYVFLSDIISMTSAGQEPDPMIMFRYMKFLPVLMVFVVLVMMGWNWSVGVGLQEKMPPGVTMKTNVFKVFLIVTVVYILAFVFLMVMVFSQVVAGGIGSPESIAFSWMSVFPFILPLHFFYLFCIFYNMYFVAKTIKTVELQRPTTFSDFVGEFFLIWFFPIGVWILQPKINVLHTKEPGSQYHTTDPSVIDGAI